jgi:uncharacterized protein YegJ (DUF2314 family)
LHDVVNLLTNYYAMYVSIDGSPLPIAGARASGQGAITDDPAVDEAFDDAAEAEPVAMNVVKRAVADEAANAGARVVKRQKSAQSARQPEPVPEPEPESTLPGYDVPAAAMEFASSTAQSTLDAFVDALQNSPKDKPFAALRVLTPDGHGQAVWLANVRLEDEGEGVFSGDIVDGPHPYAGAPGERVNISHDAIVDWLLARKRVAQGGFTLRAERSAMPEAMQKAFDADFKHRFSDELVGFNFDEQLKQAA